MENDIPPASDPSPDHGKTMPPRLRRQLDLTLGILNYLEPDLRPGVDLASRIRQEIQKIQGAGSRDRRLYRELIFTWFRYREWIDPLRTSDPVLAGQVLIFLAHFTRETAAAKGSLPPALMSAASRQLHEMASALTTLDPSHEYQPAALIPDWIEAEFPKSGTSLRPHTLERPPLWLVTLVLDSQTAVAELKKAGLRPERDPNIPGAIAVPTDSKIEATAAFRQGHLDIQDIGSQAVIHHITPLVGESWLDACAGAGGKSLLLARQIGPTGRVTAVDRRWMALKELRKRAKRSGLDQIECHDMRLENLDDASFDGVLVDAPCSGTGTWRRHPFLRHQTTLERIRGHADRQLKILIEAARMVRPGGRLAYVTCSLCRTENESVVESFLHNHSDFEPETGPSPIGLPPAAGTGHHVLPEQFNGDGFYVALLHRKALG